ncbi:hypothetical protein HELRODRAFT_162503 [Helobdella robusta]|uniref:Glycosyl transferase 64 domain-containing protein n=1 Tax=Helobdella robusta TaxID=6412 RepID=T1ESR5_HELRO|nr:hypothetical protein HELRODRAFT_162503 [Helobdella robusta]ESN99024.1 hypothetical protein HELRODRAFT_162503 [Helobdella robusta]
MLYKLMDTSKKLKLKLLYLVVVCAFLLTIHEHFNKNCIIRPATPPRGFVTSTPNFSTQAQLLSFQIFSSSLYGNQTQSSSLYVLPSSSYEDPFEYDDEPDFRVIVLTYKRFESLKLLLSTLQDLEMDGDSLHVDIWIDRDEKKNTVDNKTLQVSKSFASSNNYTSVHVQEKHAGLYKQWLLTYKPKRDDEIVLFVEDDQELSKYGYRWLKAVHAKYSFYEDYLGCTLRLLSPVHPMKIKLAGNESVFMHRVFSTHAFSPKPAKWRQFQNWFASHWKRNGFKPYVPGIRPTSWYKSFEKKNTTHHMWSMWMLYFSYVEQLFTVYSNPDIFVIKASTNFSYTTPSHVNKSVKLNATSKNLQIKKKHKCLNNDRQEKGLHFSASKQNNKLKNAQDVKRNCILLDFWDEKFVLFSNNITKIDWDGGQVFP